MIDQDKEAVAKRAGRAMTESVEKLKKGMNARRGGGIGMEEL